MIVEFGLLVISSALPISTIGIELFALAVYRNNNSALALTSSEDDCLYFYYWQRAAFKSQSRNISCAADSGIFFRSANLVFGHMHCPFCCKTWNALVLSSHAHYQPLAISDCCSGTPRHSSTCQEVLIIALPKVLFRHFTLQQNNWLLSQALSIILWAT